MISRMSRGRSVSCICVVAFAASAFTLFGGDIFLVAVAILFAMFRCVRREESE